MLRTQLRPSRTSSPESVNSSFFSAPSCFAHSLIVRVSADLKPVRCVPPSCVLMLFTNVKVFSLYRSEEHTSELQSLTNLVCRLLLEKKKKKNTRNKI